MIEYLKYDDIAREPGTVEKVNQIIDVVNVLLDAARPKTLNEAGEVVPAKDSTP